MLEENKVQQIEEKARSITRDYLGDPSEIKIPVNLAEILQKLGIRLYKATFENSTISGAYNKAEKAIYLSSDDQPVRQFFTVAHELGHYFLNPKKTTDIFYRRQLSEFGDTYPEDEQEANWFAASLLMPKEHVERIWKKEKDEKLLAIRFGVSLAAAQIRLKDLGFT